jgi:hypothetical protein
MCEDVRLITALINSNTSFYMWSEMSWFRNCFDYIHAYEDLFACGFEVIPTVLFCFDAFQAKCSSACLATLSRHDELECTPALHIRLEQLFMITHTQV